MASKRRVPEPVPWPRFDDLEAVEALAKEYPPPTEPERLEEAEQNSPEGVLAAHLSRWFAAAAAALLSDDLPVGEHQRLRLVVHRVTRGPNKDTPKERRLAVLRIIDNAANAPPPRADKGERGVLPFEPEPTPDEQALSRQQRIASAMLAWFTATHPDDAPALRSPENHRALLDAVARWNDPAIWQEGQAPTKRAHSEAKFELVARGIEGTSFHCTGEALRSLWRRYGKKK